MARRLAFEIDDITERLRQLARYALWLIPIAALAAVISWFFLLRTPTEGTGVSNPTGTSETASDNPPDASVGSSSSAQQPEQTVADNSNAVSSTSGSGDASGTGTNAGGTGSGNSGTSSNTARSSEDLPETGPADNLAVFLAASAAGTLFWEYRQRRVHQESN